MEAKRSALQPHLVPDELVLWGGKPSLDGYLSRGCIPSCLGMFCLLLLMVWLIGAFGVVKGFLSTPAFWSPSRLSPERLIGLTSAVVTAGLLFGGLYLTFARYAAGYLAWRNTEYMITEDRVLARTGSLSPALVSIPLEYISSVRAEDRSSIDGDLVLFLRRPAGWDDSADDLPPSFALAAVPDVAQVRAMLEAARARHQLRHGVDDW